jgi:hypothetical protein
MLSALAMLSDAVDLIIDDDDNNNCHGGQVRLVFDWNCGRSRDYLACYYLDF